MQVGENQQLLSLSAGKQFFQLQQALDPGRFLFSELSGGYKMMV
jgi:hypothetical protein